MTADLFQFVFIGKHKPKWKKKKNLGKPINE